MSKSIKLWDGKAPGYAADSSVPKIHYYPAREKRGDGCVLIFPGGAYVNRAVHEGDGYAKFFTEQGIDSFVVDYRVKPTRFPFPLLDARRAIRYVRANAKIFDIDPNKIAVMGSSAGGHLAALVSTYSAPIDGEDVDELDWVDFLPNAQILCYPVMDKESHSSSYINLLGNECTDSDKNKVTPLLLANEGTPQAFIWHTSSDESVDVNGSFRYAMKLRELRIPVEMHVYPVGGHGLGLGNHPEKNIDIPYIQNWADHLINWLKLNKYI